MARRPGLGLLTVLCSATLLMVLLGGGQGAGPQTAQPASAEDFKQLRESLKTLMEEHRNLSDVVSKRATMDPPIGTIVAFVGSWPPTGPKREPSTELEIGWIVCDGRKLSDVEATLREQSAKLGEKVPQGGFLRDLTVVLPQSQTTTGTLPDLQGYFLRGYDPKGLRDRGTLVQGSQRQMGELGVEQLYTTALPRETAFKSGDQSDNPLYRRIDFIHAYVFQTGKGQSASYFNGESPGGNKPRPESEYPTRKVEGNHTHLVSSGGDQETRPTNKAVNWIIKFR